jgi:hypothetical protein
MTQKSIKISCFLTNAGDLSMSKVVRPMNSAR